MRRSQRQAIVSLIVLLCGWSSTAQADDILTGRPRPEDFLRMLGVQVADVPPEKLPGLLRIAAVVEPRDHFAPYPGIDKRIALTAWRRLDKFDEFDEQRIVRFIDAHIGIDHHPR